MKGDGPVRWGHRQLTSARKYLPGGTPVTGQQFDYLLDGVGNRQSTTPGSGSAIAYTPNALNQYTSVNTAGEVHASGPARP